VHTVQHHHAHVAAVLAEHAVPPGQVVLGVAFDGTGYGLDGAVWGGEALLAGYGDFVRLAHLDYVPLAGGDAAVRRPYRMALAHLQHAGLDWSEDLPAVAACPRSERAVLAHQVATGLASAPTSSMGRLFDAVASLAGVCHEVTYEAQAAMELQALAERAGAQWPAVDLGPGYRLPLLTGPLPWRWDVTALVRAVVADVRAQAAPALIAWRFHRGLAGAVRELADRAVAAGLVQDPLRRVALSGGVFANALLTELVTRFLTTAGYHVLRHRKVPPGDGGLALGQVAVLAARQGGAAADPAARQGGDGQMATSR
jgi:hydrogenase maturation protein HypF